MTTPSAILSLMLRNPVPWNARIGEEERICIEFADALRAFTIDGSLRANWCHVPNEGKRHILIALIMRAMGVITGAPDYMFAWQDGSGFIEMKTPKGRQTESQKNFQAWCVMAGVPYVICRTAKEGLDTLRGWGVLDGKSA